MYLDLVTYDEIHPAYRALFGCHEAFRRLGFPAASIFVALGDKAGVNKGIAISVLRYRGKEFSVGAGLFDGTEEEFVKGWTFFVEAIGDSRVSNEVMERIWRESVVAQNMVGFIAALTGKGLTPPKDSNWCLSTGWVFLLFKWRSRTIAHGAVKASPAVMCVSSWRPNRPPTRYFASGKS